MIKTSSVNFNGETCNGIPYCPKNEILTHVFPTYENKFANRFRILSVLWLFCISLVTCNVTVNYVNQYDILKHGVILGLQTSKLK